MARRSGRTAYAVHGRRERTAQSSRRADMAKTTIQVVWVFETDKASNVVLE